LRSRGGGRLAEDPRNGGRVNHIGLYILSKFASLHFLKIHLKLSSSVKNGMSKKKDRYTTWRQPYR